MDKIIPRRPYEDDKPDGYLESDDDYFHNNRFAAIELLDLQLAAQQSVQADVCHLCGTNYVLHALYCHYCGTRR